MSAISGTVGAVLGAKSQDKATSANLKNTKKTNKLNYQMFQEARGSTGSAVLPLYLQGLEKQLGQDLTNSYNATNIDFSQFTDRANNPQLTSAQQSATSLVPQIFNGGIENQMLANFAPEAQARVNAAKEAAAQAEAATLANINAQRAAQGFTGDSLANQMLQFEARRQAANAVQQAQVSNVAQERAIRDAALNMQLQSLALPYQMQQQDMASFMLPQTSYINYLNQRMTPLQFLYMGPGTAFQNQNMPTVQPSATAGQLAAQAMSGVGNAALNYFMQKNLANSYAGVAAQAAPTAATSAAVAPAATSLFAETPTLSYQ